MPGKRGNPNLVKGGPSLNPKGRPKGSKNTRTEMQNKLIDSFAGEMEKDFLAVVRSIVRKAKDGDMTAAKILMDRAIPARKSVEHFGAQDALQGVTINIAPLQEGQNPMKVVGKDKDAPLEVEYQVTDDDEENSDE